MPFDVDPTNAMTKEQTLNSVNMGRALPDQPVAFPVRAAQIFFLNTRYSGHDQRRHYAVCTTPTLGSDYW